MGYEASRITLNKTGIADLNIEYKYCKIAGVNSGGSAGYGYLPYKYVDDFCWDSWLVKDISVTPDMLKGTRKLID